MSDNPYRSRRDGFSLVWFLLLSLVLNGSAAYFGFWLKLPEQPPMILTAVDTNDAPPLGDPNAPEVFYTFQIVNDSAATVAFRLEIVRFDDIPVSS